MGLGITYFRGDYIKLPKEQNIAVRLSGKVKNFTGKGPAIIQVKIDQSLVTVQLKWILSSLGKNYLCNCKDRNLVTTMQKKLAEDAKGKLLQALEGVFKSDAKILDVSEEVLQEQLSMQAIIWESAS